MKNAVVDYNGTPFKVGDKVRIERKVASHDPDGMGDDKPWNCSWNDGMDRYVGCEGYITLACDYGVKITGEGFPWMWPLAALRNLTVKGAPKYELKPFQRVVTRDGWQWIVAVHPESLEGLYLIREEKRHRGQLLWPGQDGDHRPECEIVEVYDPPVWLNEMLDPLKRGEMVWHEGLDMERAKRAQMIRRIEQQRDELNTRLEQLNKEQSECKLPTSF
jgi:hypothetical protein